MTDTAIEIAIRLDSPELRVGQMTLRRELKEHIARIIRSSRL